MRERQLGAVLYYIAGSLLQVSSSKLLGDDTSLTAIAVLIMGRFVYGLGIGISMHAAPAYLGKMSPSSIRGFMLSMKEAANTLGVRVGYQIGHEVSETPGSWINSYPISTLFAAAILVVSLWLPESVRWLLLHDRDQAAKISLRFLYPRDGTVERVYKQIKMHIVGRRQKSTDTMDTAEQACDSTKEEQRNNLWDVSNRRDLFVGVGIIALH